MLLAAAAVPGAVLRSIEPRRAPNAEMAIGVDVQGVIAELVDTMLSYDPPG